MERETLPLKELARAVAGTKNSTLVSTVTRQIQHWTSTGLLDRVGLKQKSVGRGRVRKYPREMVYWCALLHALAQTGYTNSDMEEVLKHLSRGAERKLVAQAMAGRGLDVYLVFYSPPSNLKKSYPALQQLELFKGSVTLKSEWVFGSFVNLSAIFATVHD